MRAPEHGEPVDWLTMENPKCWARSLEDCTREMSKDHPVSVQLLPHEAPPASLWAGCLAAARSVTVSYEWPMPENLHGDFKVTAGTYVLVRGERAPGARQRVRRAPRVEEVGDGQVAGLPDCEEPAAFLAGVIRRLS